MKEIIIRIRTNGKIDFANWSTTITEADSAQIEVKQIGGVQRAAAVAESAVEPASEPAVARPRTKRASAPRLTRQERAEHMRYGKTPDGYPRGRKGYIDLGAAAVMDPRIIIDPMKGPNRNPTINVPETARNFGWTLDYIRDNRWARGSMQARLKHALRMQKISREPERRQRQVLVEI